MFWALFNNMSSKRAIKLVQDIRDLVEECRILGGEFNQLICQCYDTMLRMLQMELNGHRFDKETIKIRNDMMNVIKRYQSS